MSTAAPPETPGFVAGVRCLFGGFAFLLRTPSAWPLALVPATVVVALGSFLGFLSFRFVPRLVADVYARHAGAEGTLDAVLSAGAQVVATILAVLFSFFLAFSLAQPLSGPALEALVRRQEVELGAPARPDTPFLVDIGRSLRSSLVGLAIGTPILALLMVVNLVFPPAQVVTFPLKAIVVTTVLAWDVCDYPLTVRGLAIRVRVGFLQRHFFAVLGMAAGVALLALVPCGVLFALPIGVAGATRLLAEIERVEGRVG